MNASYRMLVSAGLALSGALTSASGTLADNLLCEAGPAIVLKRKADLPRPVLNLIEKDGPMADVGEPFQSTDIVSNPALPLRRFISAHQYACDLVINYERGGRGLARETILLRQTEGGWIVRK
jgi:hypothetical protein